VLAARLLGARRLRRRRRRAVAIVLMFVSELWRYPVKSMGGEQLQSCELNELGIIGDRVVHVEDASGRVLTARSRPRLLLHCSILGPDGEPLVDGKPWSEVSVEAAAGEGARLVRYDGPERFDVLPLLVATDGAIAFIGEDRRRFRPNILIGGVSGLDERGWEGRRLQIGQARIGAVSLRERCVMTTYDPDTADQDREVLRRIRRELGGQLALDCEVVRPGRIQVGDEVVLF
jgi:uncharacterized protein YcbX